MASVDRRGVGTRRQCRQREGEREQPAEEKPEYHQTMYVAVTPPSTVRVWPLT